jgi:hypothetical protein
MINFIAKNNMILYDIETMKQILNVPKSKIQRELKKQETEIVKYKNLFLYPQKTLFVLMELILIEKLEKRNGKLQQDKEME